MPTAVAETVSDAVATAVNTLSLSPTPAAILQRKRPYLLDGDLLPLVVVSVGDGEDFEPVGADVAGNLTWVVSYPCSVAVAFRQGGKAGENSDLRNWLQTIWAGLTRGALYTAGLTQVNEVYPAGRPFFDVPASGAGIDWGAKHFRIETLEAR